jgi:hypothetical protein
VQRAVVVGRDHDINACLACHAETASFRAVDPHAASADASTAIPFAFVGHGALAGPIGLYALYLWGPVRMSQEEEQLDRLAFRRLNRREFLDLVMLGTWEAPRSGKKIISRSERPDGPRRESGSIRLRQRRIRTCGRAGGAWARPLHYGTKNS